MVFIYFLGKITFQQNTCLKRLKIVKTFNNTVFN